MDDINDFIRAHETTVEWAYDDLSRVCYAVFDLLNESFFESRLKPSCLVFEHINMRQKGQALPGDNGFGAPHELRLNSVHFYSALKEILATMAHHMVHQWQDQQHPERNNSRRYHDQEFRAKCAEIGVPCIEPFKCGVFEITEPFLNFLAEAGIEVDAKAVPTAEAVVKSKSTSKKWSCGCTNGRFGVKPDVVCRRCGRPFVCMEGETEADQSSEEVSSDSDVPAEGSSTPVSVTGKPKRCKLTCGCGANIWAFPEMVVVHSECGTRFAVVKGTKGYDIP